MNDSIDDAARRAWQSEPPGTKNVLPVPAIDRRLREQQRRKRWFLASAAIIVPGWMAAFWFFPDLRPVATVGLIVAASLAWLTLRRGAPSRPQAAAEPCAAFQIGVLTRERAFHRSLPAYLIPVVIGQVAIVATLLINPRFEKNAVFAGSLTVFVFTVVVILLAACRRSRRMLAEIDRELLILGKGVEA